MYQWFIALLLSSSITFAHPLRLSLCEIEFYSKKNLLAVNLKLFLTDVNEALVFNPNSTELAFCQPNEHSDADKMLMDYLNRFFYVKFDRKKINLKIKKKKLSGDGENTALWIYLEKSVVGKFNSMEVKNAVFTDLFYDQSNIVYIHIDEESKSIMLNKETSIYELNF